MQPKLRILILSLCLLSLYTKAQDTIAFKLGLKLATHVIRAADTITYKKFAGNDTATLCMAMKWNVSYIRYANGKLVSFERKAKDTDRQLAIKLGLNIYGYADNGLYNQGFAASLSYTGQRLGKKKRFAPEVELATLEMGGILVPYQKIAVYTNGQTLGLFNTNYFLHFRYVAVNALGLFYPSHSNGFYFKGGVCASYLLSEETTTQLNPPINDLYQKSEFRTGNAGLVYGLGMRSNAKKVGFLFEVVAVNYLTSLGILDSEGNKIHHCSVQGNVGVFMNL
jgi:hypothetical protein